MRDDAPMEGRKEPRADVVLKVEYPDAEGFLQDYTVNISRGGTMIRVSRSLRRAAYAAATSAMWTLPSSSVPRPMSAEAWMKGMSDPVRPNRVAP